eukprot:TRINITY_DN1885_c0_g1::TRINITY_DN1885_c0_g1_i1::g.14121::m.14121 TRINITY_DN1885_c0_g1::TRINITY_DN1885_c0_g1_i1::g.14121  ORF type:complete len:611 (-),score=132.46,sp/Q9FN03/UVR8_ARATH/32.30/3e-57,sp/Q9FN03/UVR8_ARATH/37.42/9e-56,sp/Q9FN03/UVR8_ARATH/34.86/2e-50,sp/Q9FN03/UVR8_ARATH/38.04/7e-46,sp/Q9FN03/UVR8_ARATH/37.10/4e-33,sp/Q9FN03/UVR8_ARATH/37.36/2e-07,RCC1/PF00415.13/0.0013,RCC1/PF00415.13/5.4e-13,RCC1/PF00415.13/3.6e-16,RCC1/PF00415.13/3.8e-16,RCC1/PF00415.13/0.0064,RCC1/PF00415.13/5.7e-
MATLFDHEHAIKEEDNEEDVHDNASEVVDKMLRRRSTKLMLESRNILNSREANIAPSLQDRVRQMERRQSKLLINNFLTHRLDRTELIHRNILVEEAGMSPSLLATQKALERKQRKKSLADKLAIRPNRADLVQHNILKDVDTAGSLQSAASRLERKKKRDELTNLLGCRPKYEDLIHRSIIVDMGTPRPDPIQTDVLVPSQLDTLPGTATQISCGYAHSAAIVGGKLFTWGLNDYGQLGIGLSRSSESAPVEVSLEAPAIAVSCGQSHTAALTNDGALYTWGWGFKGRLGHGDDRSEPEPRRVDALADVKIVSVACGSYHTAALDHSGALYTWGWGKNGRLGHGDDHDSFLPKRVASLDGKYIRQVVCGDNHTAALSSEGEVYLVGCGLHGKLATGDEVDRSTFFIPEALASLRFKAICSGSNHMLALTESGQVYAWGSADHGQLGLPDVQAIAWSSRTKPCMVDFNFEAKPVKFIAAGMAHSAFITESGSVFMFGQGEHGRLGLGNRIDVRTPECVKELEGKAIDRVSCGWNHSAALTQEGELYMFGHVGQGRLGFGDNPPHHGTPIIEETAMENDNTIVEDVESETA